MAEGDARYANKVLPVHVLDLLRELVTESQLSNESQQEISIENASIEELEQEGKNYISFI